MHDRMSTQPYGAHDRMSTQPYGAHDRMSTQPYMTVNVRSESA